MARIACLWIPDICVRAHLRLDPDLVDVPFALTDGRGPRAVVAASSDLAARFGVVVGMRATEARAVCEVVVLRPVSFAALAAAANALADVAATVSARVEIDGRERVFADCEGSGRLWSSEAALASALAARAARCGLSAWIGIADSKLGAVVAARTSGGVTIVPQGETRAFLAGFPVAVLDPDLETAATLASWGIRSVGDLMALPAGAVAHRLGPAGALLVRRARGEDDVPLVGRAVPRTFEEALDLDYGIDRIEPLVFVLRRLIECVTSRVELYGLGCKEIELGFDLDGGGRDVRSIVAAAPTTEHKIFVTLVRADLEARPLAYAVTRAVVAAAATRLAPTQLDLLRPAGPAPAALAAMLARLAALCGADRVGVLRRADSHRPDAVEVGRFEGMTPAAPLVVDRRPSPSPPTDGVTSSLGSSGTASLVRVALRAFRPPVPLEIFESRGTLDYVRGRGFGGRVVHWAGPWRLRGEWWTADPYAREYYDVELSDGGVYRVYRDARAGCWLADGVYD